VTETRSRTTPRRKSAAAASKKLVPVTYKLTDTEDEAHAVKELDTGSSEEDVKPKPKLTRRGSSNKGKGRAIIISSDDDDEGYTLKKDEAQGDEDQLMSAAAADEDEDPGVRKAHELAKKLKSTLAAAQKDKKGKGKAVDADKLASGLVRTLKGKGKARVASPSPSSSGDTGAVDERKPTQKERAAAKGKGKAKAPARPRKVAPPPDSSDDSDHSAFAPADSDSGSDYDELAEDDDDALDDDLGSASEALDLDFDDATTDEDVKPKKKKKKASAVKKQEDAEDAAAEKELDKASAEGVDGVGKKKKKDKVPLRKGAHMTKEDKKAMKKLSNVRPSFSLRSLRTTLGARLTPSPLPRRAGRPHDLPPRGQPPRAQDGVGGPVQDGAHAGREGRPACGPHAEAPAVPARGRQLAHQAGAVAVQGRLPLRRDGVRLALSPSRSFPLAARPVLTRRTSARSMGKTIQTISLILSDWSPSHPKGSTLVLAPTVAIVQWKNEIEKFTKGFKVLIFHGTNRLSNVKEMEKFDVVLTSCASPFRLLYLVGLSHVP